MATADLPSVTGPGAPSAAPPGSPVEYVRRLPPQEKQAVFLALLREALAINGDRGLMPIDDEDGNPFGYYVPPKAARAEYERFLAQMPPNVREAMTRPLPDLDRSQLLTPDELLAQLRSEEPRQSPQ
jgi:hypothetical protein